MRAPIVIDRSSSIPLHRQVYDAWRTGILARRFTRGDRIPSTRELAAALAVSRNTVATAYDQLVAEGYLQSEQGAGTFVCRDLPERPSRARRVPEATAAAPRPAVRLSQYAARLPPDAAPVKPVPGVVNLSQYSPDFHQFPFELWRRAVQRQLRQPTPAGFHYAGHGAGDVRLRYEIARYLARWRAVHCSADDVIVVSGSQQALDLCTRVLIDPGDDVAVENPGYPGARELFAAHGARVRPIAVTRDGIAVADLPPTTRVVHVTPSHQFPTGVSLSLSRRLELVAWARAHGAVIIEDDYDSEYRYSGSPLPALQGLTDAVNVVYVGTFSNVMFPGLRLGYLVAPPGLVDTFRRAKWSSDRHTALLEQAALAEFIQAGHLERHIRRMRRLYKRRREVLVDSLTHHFGDAVSMSGDAAGMFAVVRFSPGSIPADPVRHGVQLADTARYYVSGAPKHEYLIRFSALGERAIREGVRRLARGRPVA